MIVACAMLALSLAGLRAQSNEEYNFTQSIINDGFQITPAEDVPILSMDGLAANGYGQWTLSSTAGRPPAGSSTAYHVGWYLLENQLNVPSTTAHGGATSCIPPGVVQDSTLNSMTWEPRVIANLDGTTIYIWPDPSDPTKFTVQVFNSSNISIAIASGFPNSTNSRKVVRSGPFIPPLPGVTTEAPIGSSIYHDVVDDEGDFRDCCDFTMDAAFLYLTWCSTVHCPGVDTREVWVTAYNLQTWAVPSGYPMHLGQGWRPRLACDPRDNRNAISPTPQFDIAFLTDKLDYEFGSVSWFTYNGSTPTTHDLTPNFIDPYGGDLISIYYFSHICPLVSSVYGNPAAHHALYALVSNSEYDAINELVLYNDDNTNIPLDEAAYVDGPLWHPTIGSPIEDAIGNFVVDHWLDAFANPYDNGDNATDVPFHDWREYDQFHCLYQMEIELIDDGPERFPLLIVRGSDIGDDDHGFVYPAPIDPARDIDGDPYDTRLVLNQDSHGDLEGDPQANINVNCDNYWYVAAVNQMGIFVHWRNGGQHYFMRDMGVTAAPDHHISRAFDAPIDEKTLVTGTCVVTDGTVHGGTQGATIVTPQQFGALNLMTIWTDPNYGPPSLDGSIGLFTQQPDGLTYLNPYVGTLNFIGNNVVLNVGDDILHRDYDFGYYTGASLAVFPYFYFNFHGKNQGVTINYNSFFDYWGLNATHHSTLAPAIAIATPFTDGTADGYGAGTIDLEGDDATLNVHSGSDFYLGVGGALVSNGGYIDVFHDSSVYPLTSSPPLLATGHMTLWGTTTIENNSFVSGNAPAATSSDPGLDTIITSYGQYTATESYFWNTSTSGLSNIQFGNPSHYYYNSIFNGCNFEAAQIHAYPGCPGSLTVENSSFDQMRNYAICAEQNSLNPSTAPRDTIKILDNYFYAFQKDADMTINSNPPYLYGIWIRNFASVKNDYVGCSDRFTIAPIDIDGNQFVNTGNLLEAFIPVSYYPLVNNGSDGFGIPILDFDQSMADPPLPAPTSAAILLENTTANVTSNVIEDNGYSVGIGVMATIPKSPFSTPITSSLICSNTISGLSSGSSSGNFEETGMFTTNFDGFIQNNTITGCDNGFSAGGDEPHFKKAHFICNTVTGNKHITIEVNDDAILDMSGIHSPTSGGPYDKAGFNTISGQSEDGMENEIKLIYIVQDADFVANINLSNSLEDWGWSNFGHNAIILTPASGPSSSLTLEPLIWCNTTDPANIQNVDQNFFEVGGSPVDPFSGTGPCFAAPNNWPGYGAEKDDHNITYCASPLSTVPQTATDLPDWATGCQDWVSFVGTDMAKKKGSKPQSLMDMNVDSCDGLLNFGESLSEFRYYQVSYDTLQSYIDSCANTPRSFETFGYTDDDIVGQENQSYPYDSTLFAQYRVWLYSVLYLNTTDPNYFCSCVASIFNCFAYIKDFSSDSESFVSANMEVAFARWLLQNTKCDSSYEWANWQIRREQQHQLWQQDSMDGLHYPYDTTIPTLSQIGYGIDTLLAKHQLAVVSDPAVPSIILNATTSPNPVSTGTIITFGISQEAYVKINLFDILGNGVAGSGGEGYEGLFAPGNHEVPLSLQGLPSGTYFARILTAYGNVATVKLVKE